MAVFSSCEIIIAASGDGNSHLVHKETCEIVYDSILANKERTKSYWERLMVAAQGRPQSRPPAISAPSLNGRGEMEVYNHLRSASSESMSSGHSSGSSDPVPVRKRSWPRKIDSPPLHLNFKETPIEKEIRLAKEREEELKREKLHTSVNHISSGTETKKVVEVRKVSGMNSHHTPVTEVKIKQVSPPPVLSTDSPEADSEVSYPKDDIKAELESISLKKCVSMSNLPMSMKNEQESSLANSHMIKVSSNMKHFRLQQNRQSLSNVSAPKLFIPNKSQKGLMKKFLESHGRIASTFTVAQPIQANIPSNKNWSTENLHKSVDRNQLSSSLDDLINLTLLGVPNTLSLHHPNSSLKKHRSQSESIVEHVLPPVQSRRPGYISAEDKIQMELKEMKQREAELKKERARLLGRSQPNLQKLEDSESKYSDKDDDTPKLPPMGKLRSALSNPNLMASKPPMQKVPIKKRSALIDAWENRIRSTQ